MRLLSLLPILAPILALAATYGCSSSPDSASPAEDGGGSSDATATNDATASDGSSSPDAATADAGPDAVVGCQPKPVDAGYVDGAIIDLPTVTVPVLPPVVTPQPQRDATSKHIQKQIGVLNTSPNFQDAQSVLHMLKPMGLPYAVTGSTKQSLSHDMAIFFPEAYPENFDASELDSIKQYLLKGGAMVIKYSEVPTLKEVGGLSGSVFQAEHHSVKLTAAGKTEFPSLDMPEEQEIPLGGNAADFLNTWTLTVDPAASSTATVLATFEDGRPAVVKNAYGPGVVYTYGVDWRDVVLRNQLGHHLDAARAYINTFEPATDTWMMMMRDIYDAHVRFGARFTTAPSGAKAAVLMTFDLDFSNSYTNALAFAQDLKSKGATGTFFVHTKVVTDSQDTAFFTGLRGPQMAQFISLGHTVASHTVAHSPVLDAMPKGDGTESYPSYKPFNVSKTETRNGTLFGELRVSKSLIDGALREACSPHETLTFRAGELSFHPAAAETLERVGYHSDATRAVGDVVGNFPFRMMTDWPAALDTSVFEFPATLEDELPPRMDVRVPAMLAVIRANAANGAPTTVLSHPNITDYKLQVQQEILAGLPSGVKAMGLEHYAEFWRARDQAEITAVEYDQSQKTVSVTVLPGASMTGLTLRMSSEVTGVKSPQGATFAAQGALGGYVTLPPLTAGTPVTVVMSFQ